MSKVLKTHCVHLSSTVGVKIIVVEDGAIHIVALDRADPDLNFEIGTVRRSETDDTVQLFKDETPKEFL